MGSFGAGFVKLGCRDIQNIVVGQNAAAPLHRFDIDAKSVCLGNDLEILSPVLPVHGTEGSGGAGQMIRIGEYDFTKAAGESHHSGLRKLIFLPVPDIGYVMVPKRIFDQLTGKKLLFVADGDLYVRGVVQNNLLHANLIATKASTKPTKMAVNGT